MKDKKKKVYLKLFTSAFYLSAFTFGGGYVIIPLMKRKFADELKWIEEKEMLNLTAIAQSSPGPVAVNAAMLLGYRVAGAPGGLVTVLGTILPPFITLSVVSLFYAAFRDNPIVNAVLKGTQAGVAAVIADVSLSLGKNVVKERDILSVIIMAAVFVLIFFLKVNVMLIILACAIIGAARILFKMKKEAKGGDEQ